MSHPRHLTPQRPWQPMSDQEWCVLTPYVFRATAGRPIENPRLRLDAIFWLAAQKATVRWADLPAHFGKSDTVHRQFRRWATQGLWRRLLLALVDPTTPGVETLRGMASWLCRAYRRDWRRYGLAGIVLAKRLGLLSALRGPPWLLPDPELSAAIWPYLHTALDTPIRRDRIRLFMNLLTTIMGRGVPRHLVWP